MSISVPTSRRVGSPGAAANRVAVTKRCDAKCVFDVFLVRATSLAVSEIRLKRAGAKNRRFTPGNRW
jgi:hypothetical protein